MVEPLAPLDPVKNHLDRLIERFPVKDVPEETAFEAFTFLQASPERPEVPGQSQEAFDAMRASLGAYVAKNRAQGTPIFPKESAELNKKRTDYLKKLYTEEPNTFLEGSQLAAYEETLKLTPDPDAYRARSANKTYLEALAGAPIPEDRFDFVRDQYARNAFQLEDTSDKALFSTIKERYAQHDQASDLIQSNGSKLYQDALTGTSRDEITHFRKQAEESGIPEHLIDGSAEQLQAAFRQGQADRRDAMPLVKQIVTGFAVMRGRDLKAEQIADPNDEVFTTISDAVEELSRYNKEKRDRILPCFPGTRPTPRNS